MKTMIYLELPPSPPFGKIILKFYNVSGYTSPERPYVERTLPNGYTSMLFHLRKKIVVSNVQYDGNNIPNYYLFGKYTSPIFVDHTFGPADCFGVIFHPGAFRHILAAPQNKFSDKVEDARDVMGYKIREVVSQLEDSTHPFPDTYKTALTVLKKRRFILESYFTSILHYRSIEHNIVDTILERIHRSDHKPTLKAFSKNFRVSPQHLNRLFQQQVGLSIIQYARIYRFNLLIRNWHKHTEKSLSQLADEFDYADRSHLIKDFYKFAGGRPSDFIRNKNELAHFLLHE